MAPHTMQLAGRALLDAMDEHQLPPGELGGIAAAIRSGHSTRRCEEHLARPASDIQ